MAQMILPKGIVFNKNSIYEAIAEYDIVPIDRILAACHVYSTTSRELFDPTAHRLENFWNRVLGGDRRYLSGPVISRLFRDISEEPPFVRLRGPANRYEPPSPKSPADASRNRQTPANPSSTQKSTPKGKANATPAQPSKVPHPILKKPRGPSSTGPRPTARFASPPGSDGDEVTSRENEIPSSGSTAVTQSLESKEPANSVAKPEKKKASSNAPKKKTAAFVASTGSRRRPAMPRRQSSQTSTGSASDVALKEGNTSMASKNSGPLGADQTIHESPGEEPRQRPSESQKAEPLSAKAAGKRPVSESKNETMASKAGGSERARRHEKPTSQKDRIGDEEVQRRPEGEGEARKIGQTGIRHRRSDAPERQPLKGGPRANRSKSDISGLVTPQSLLSTSTATVSNATAQGTIIEYDENAPAKEAVSSVMRQQEELPEAQRIPLPRSAPTENEPRFTPTQPSTTPTLPLGRSKSQLTLLLEKQNEKRPRR
ncbi:hypothetical protein F4780DRAFT_781068 [Xylariomycetidae sp. FL0641]|nr:hypothetical protein F4780DRAFT_781068 [Xylariomycetidae sp. FL0641]